MKKFFALLVLVFFSGAGADIQFDCIRTTYATCETADGAVLSRHNTKEKAAFACAQRQLNDPGTQYIAKGAACRIEVSGFTEANAQSLIASQNWPVNPAPPSTVVKYADDELRLPFDSIDDANGKHGTYDIYWQPLDTNGDLLGSATLINDVEIYEDQGAAQLAFPGALGFGRNAEGGWDSPTVYIIDSLANSGTGTFRECLEASGDRVCVFDVAGDITLTSRVEIQNDDIRIDCQSAPGDGVQITGDAVVIEASDVVIRHCKFRPDAGTDNDSSWAALSITGSPGNSDIIWDHIETMFHSDENMDIWGAHSNITIQYSINGWGLDCAGAAEGVTTGCAHGDGRHSKGMLLGSSSGITPPTNISFFYNGFGNSIDRLPYLNRGGDIDNRYNMYFNKGAAGGSNSAWAVHSPLRGPMEVNFIGNKVDRRASNSTNDQIRGSTDVFDDTSSMYAASNCDESDNTEAAVLQGDWSAASEFDYPDEGVTAVACTGDVLRDFLDGLIGAIYPGIDAVTDRFHNDMAEVTTGDFTVNTASEIEGGLPDLTTSGTAHAGAYDADADGMEDAWENHANNNGGSILPGTVRDNGWPNLHNFLNDLANDGSADGDGVWAQWTHDAQGGNTTGYRVWIRENGAGHSAGAVHQDFTVTTP